MFLFTKAPYILTIDHYCEKNTSYVDTFTSEDQKFRPIYETH